MRFVSIIFITNKKMFKIAFNNLCLLRNNFQNILIFIPARHRKTKDFLEENLIPVTTLLQIFLLY